MQSFVTAPKTPVPPRWRFEFMKHRRVWIFVSLSLIVGSLGWWAFGPPPNLGIEFAGGSQLTLRFQREPDRTALRSALSQADLRAQLQQIGADEENTLIVRVPSLKDRDADPVLLVQEAIDRELQPNLDRWQDLNRLGGLGLEELLREAGFEESVIDSAVSSLRRARLEVGVFESWEQVAIQTSLQPNVQDVLETETRLGQYSVLATSMVSPQVSGEMRDRGLLAVVSALLAMLVYIWLRFEIAFGIGAIMASLHDVIVAAGLFVAAGLEVDLTTVAALLTLVGYSVNDTVVVFDRVRENRSIHPTLDPVKLLDLSLNQTLTRTLATSGTTLLAALPLLVLGGEALRGFSFLIVVGVVVGTYSTIYIAGPFALWWQENTRRRASSAAAGE